ncbi:hypothetical protein [Pseudoxanthomonas sp. PXM01]|uniref:hypothetical protein n=1 Tax=Pseudoxanthomonas sp. PXM01 TaxID=2769295 RepID=UPI00177E4DC1|nr:hypothetical protein [Pseudoxanthomonas sp. PXM01]MBD9470826.1 hypothetical protein [Pseudoxanthomonas sp. PXM01]
MTHRSLLPLGVLVILLTSVTACAGALLEPHYSRNAVQPVIVQAGDDGNVRIRFVSPPESLYYAAGVSYRTMGDALQVVIDRCPIRGDCTTMVKGTRLDDARTVEVSLPFRSKRLVMIHADGTQPLLP